MADRERRAKKRRFGWRRPRYKDPAFWAAVALATLAMGAQARLANDLSDPFTWLGLALRAVLTWVLISAVIRIRVGIRRGLVAGYAEAEVKAEHRDSGTSKPEELARTSGRTIGRAVGAYKRSQAKR